jgi:hypothetical protein
LHAHEAGGDRRKLDSDLGELYGVSVKRLNQQVKRNSDRFPADFMFQVTAQEYTALRLQIAASKPGRGGRQQVRQGNAGLQAKRHRLRRGAASSNSKHARITARIRISPRLSEHEAADAATRDEPADCADSGRMATKRSVTASAAEREASLKAVGQLLAGNATEAAALAAPLNYDVARLEDRATGNPLGSYFFCSAGRIAHFNSSTQFNTTTIFVAYIF